MDFESSMERDTETITSQEEKSRLENLSRLDEFHNTEKIVRPQTETGKNNGTINHTKDRVFTQKVDEKFNNVKKRVKILSTVYICVLVLLLSFVVANLITQHQLNKQVKQNTETIQTLENELSGQTVNSVSNTTEPDISVSVTEQRAYTDDDVNLTFWDKLTNFFDNLFR